MTLLRTGAHNRVLVRFLVQQATRRMETRLRALRDFYPAACAADWSLVDAGIRVQALKKAEASRLSFGTEVVTAPPTAHSPPSSAPRRVPPSLRRSRWK